MGRITKDICAALNLEPKRPEVVGLRARLKRHPIPVRATFRHSVVLTYALPEAILKPLLPPGLLLDTFKGLGFVAIALVQTQSLRPKFCPRCLGQNFFLSGYRIFTRYKTPAGRTLRGLRILRSDTDRTLMAIAGNCLTHYNYQAADVRYHESDDQLEIDIKTPRGDADLSVVADLRSEPAPLPDRSPFANCREARLFAGPLPFTFDYEAESDSIIVIEGVRRHWNPQPIRVNVRRKTFFDRAPFNGVEPLLANAFHVTNIEYEWKRGERHPLASN